MEFKGTPGPWFIESDEDDESQLNIVSDSRPYVATVWPDAFIQSKEQQANANIIAAAPDLLEALVMAVEEYKELPHSLGYDFTHLPKMEAAIAKALGENNV